MINCIFRKAFCIPEVIEIFHHQRDDKFFNEFSNYNKMHIAPATAHKDLNYFNI